MKKLVDSLIEDINTFTNDYDIEMDDETKSELVSTILETVNVHLMKKMDII